MCAIEQKDERFAVLKVDIKSAPPKSHRGKMRRAVRERSPRLLGIFDFLYGATNHHTFVTSDQGACRVQQDHGIIQGSELSMLFFGLYSHGPIEPRPQGPQDMTLKYADDFFIHGDVDQVMGVFRALKQDFREQAGLGFSPHTPELYVPAASNADIAVLTDRCHVKVTSRGVPVLGAPIGDTNYTVSKLGQKVVDYGDKVERCVSVCTKQVALAIVQHAAPAYQYIVAVLPPDETRQLAERIDSINAQVLRDNVFDAPPRPKLMMRGGASSCRGLRCDFVMGGLGCYH